MLGKLLKYDLKWTYKVLVVLYCLAGIFTALSMIFNSIQTDSVLFSILSSFSSGFAVSMAVSALINCIMRSWARFVSNIYKDESYLTHTLPVSKKEIYLSKILSSIICTFTTVAVSAVCIVLCYYSNETVVEALNNMLKIAADTFNTTAVNFVIIISIVAFLEVLFILFVGYFGIIIGHRSNKNKMLKSIIYAVAFYLLTNAFTVVLVMIAGLFNSDIMNLIKTNEMVNFDIIKNIMLFAIVLYSVLNVLYYVAGKVQLSKGVNVD